MYLLSQIKNSLGIRSKKPRILSYLITDYCNSHCITCSVWRNKKINHIEERQLSEVVQSALFNDVEHVGISGGEPSTFVNLREHLHVFLNNLPNIKTVSITSNCINYQFWLENLCSIYEACSTKNVYFQLNVSLDGVGHIHDRIRGTKGNFKAVENVINFAQKNAIPFQIHSTINHHNVYHVGALLHYAKCKKADIIFRLASEIYRLDNCNQIDRVALDDGEKSFICDFFNSDELLSYTKSPGRRLFYHYLVSQLLVKTRRRAPCYFKEQGLVLSADGKFSYCSRFATDFGDVSDDGNRLLLKFQNHQLFEQCSSHACDDCYHDQNGLWPLHNVISEYLAPYILNLQKITFVAKSHMKSFLLTKNKVIAKNVEQICIIGMYGGEHVGDAAILGGVLLRTLSRYPSLKRVYVYSFRPDRTSCWISNLTLLTKSIVIESVGKNSDFVEHLKDSQLLLWAGGPLMELPVVLSRNYYFIRKALSLGVRFEMEGIGYGPINSFYGKCITGKILSKAHYLTTRSERDFKNVVSPIKSKDYLYDPAFDYLRLLHNDLGIDIACLKRIDKLFAGEHTGVIALNIRPLWGRYGNVEDFNSELFMDELVKLVCTLDQNGLKTIFFPMNADRYGFSDLEVAYNLKDKLPKDSSFTIWETEPSINELVFFLRKVDVALCMRFHAVIFAKSQNVQTIGIDYSLSGKGKVSTLFDNESDCIPLREFEEKRVKELITRKLNNGTMRH